MMGPTATVIQPQPRPDVPPRDMATHDLGLCGPLSSSFFVSWIPFCRFCLGIKNEQTFNRSVLFGRNISRHCSENMCTKQNWSRIVGDRGRGNKIYAFLNKDLFISSRNFRSQQRRCTLFQTTQTRIMIRATWNIFHVKIYKGQKGCSPWQPNEFHAAAFSKWENRSVRQGKFLDKSICTL